MKFFAFLAAILFMGCNGTQTLVTNENSKRPMTKQRTAKSSNGSPSDFDNLLPVRVREALENAEEIEILTLDENLKDAPVIEKFRITFPISGNKLTKIPKNEIRTELLDAFYEDVETGGSKAACFASHHTIKVDYKGEKIAIAICFQCGHFVGIISDTQFGEKIIDKKEKKNPKEERFGGAVPNMETSKSLPIFNKITTN